MTPEIYQSLALRTVPPEQQFWNLDPNEPSKSSHPQKSKFLQGPDDPLSPHYRNSPIKQAQRNLLLNATLGLCGEAAEVAMKPSPDECGDAYWYAYVLMKALEIPCLTPDINRLESPNTLTLLIYSGSIAELVKKHVFHAKPLDPLLPRLIHLLRDYLCVIAFLDPNTPSETFAGNINKLKARYPEGFSFHKQDS